jgi:Family of unknown function (DUF6262)
MPELTGLQAAAQRKRDATIQRATAALAELAEQGAQISFQSVARRAGVSRQWLYDQPALRTQIEQLRERPAQGVPARERASDASLQQRLRGLLDDNHALREQVPCGLRVALFVGPRASSPRPRGPPIIPIPSRP